jgi:predicted DNA-binding transcriptional regulator AlpA
VSKVISAWGSWREASNAYRGAWTQPTPKQRALRRSVRARKWSHEEHITSLRHWLDTKPATQTMADYDAWAEAANDPAAASRLRYPKVNAIRYGTGLPWRDLLAIARKETTYEERAEAQLEARREAQKARVAGHDLVGRGDVALILGWSPRTMEAYTDLPTFPRPVARLGTYRVWLRSDVEAYRDGERVPARAERELQDDLLTTRQVAERLGKDPMTVRAQLSMHRFHLCPPPDGNIAGTNYWYRDTFEKWLEANPRRKARRQRAPQSN